MTLLLSILSMLLTMVGTIFGAMHFMRNETKEWRREHREDIKEMDAKWIAVMTAFVSCLKNRS